MSDLIAIAVAVLPPPAVSDAAIALNRRLPPGQSKGLHLDRAHLPHITLTQHFVSATASLALMRVIDPLVTTRPPLALTVSGPGRGRSSVWMKVTRTPELAALHAAVMDALRPFERAEGTTESFVDGDARAGDVAWVRGFRESAAYDRFHPHITIGHASELPDVAPRSFFADTIALCRLGRFCTCRTVLRTWTL